jgi:hypothetical protein
VELGQDDNSGDEGDYYASKYEALDDDNGENVEGDNKESRTNFETLTPTRTCLFFPCTL